MKSKTTSAAVIAVSLAVLTGTALAAQDKDTLKAPNGVAFSEFKGYESWQNVVPSVVDEGIKSVLANPAYFCAGAGRPEIGCVHPEGHQAIPRLQRMGIRQFNYDAPSGTFKPFGDDSSFAMKCYKCHTIVKEKDYIFTACAER